MATSKDFFTASLPATKNGVYVNMKQRKEWLSPKKQAPPQAKQELHPRKKMLCVWWDWEEIIHHELLANNETVNAELYVQKNASNQRSNSSKAT